MSANTIAENQQRDFSQGKESLWLFGYGSLIFKADFPFLQKKPAWIKGWQRRFWQGSHDHRGTETHPGRVVTLIEAADVICHGMAYQIERAVVEHLDFREKNGYLRFSTPMQFHDGTSSESLIYIATQDNDAFLGAADMQEMAQQIASACGPSGNNSDYLILLAAALREMQADDEHVFELERRVSALVVA